MSDAVGPELELEEEPKFNTAQLMDLLRTKYPRDRYALFFNVPDAVSLDARRRIDAVAVGIWKSVGREVDAFEIKVSRSDWLRELKQVDKADPFISICDRFWLVTADSKIAKLDEIPAAWGWMSATKHGLRVQRPAAKLPTSRDNMPWGFIVGLLRKLQEDLLNSADVRAHIKEKIDERDRWHKVEIERATSRASHDLEGLRAAVKAFEDAAGVELGKYSAGNIGETVKALNNLKWRGGTSAIPKMLREHAEHARALLADVDNAVAAMESAMGQEQLP